MPSIAPHTVVTGIDIQTKPGLYLFTTYYYSDKIPLNDDNSVYSSSYNLASFRIGYKRNLSQKIRLDIFGGVDNLFDQTYSLGNDINAFGGRFYNAAPGRNYFAGLSLGFAWKSENIGTLY